MKDVVLSERTLRVLDLAREEAHRMHHDFIGTEHLLLGLLLEGTGLTAELLLEADVEVDAVRERIGGGFDEEDGDDTGGSLPYTARAQSCLRRASREAGRHRSVEVEPEHVLLALLQDQDGVAAQALLDCGLCLEDIREELDGMLEEEESFGPGQTVRPEGEGPAGEAALRALYEAGGLRIPSELEDWFERRRRLEALVDEARELRERKDAAIREENYEGAARIKAELEAIEVRREEAASDLGEPPPGLGFETMLLAQNRRMIELLEAILARLDDAGGI